MKRTKKIIWIFASLLLLSACNENPDVRGIPDPAEVKSATPDSTDVKTELENLEKEGFDVSIYEFEDRPVIRQKYFVAVFKEVDTVGRDRNLELQQAYLERISQEEYVSLWGPVEEHSSNLGMVIYNTRNILQADSLARSNPLVKEGKIEVEIFPWRAYKGGKLK